MITLLVEILKLLTIALTVILFLLIVVFRIVRHYRHFPIPALATQLIDNPFRRRFLQRPHAIADRMRLTPGMIVVEIGPGKGNYTKAVASRLLPNGKVYAIDIQEWIINKLKKKVQKEQITNIEPRIDNAKKCSFSNDSIDRVLAITCLPEIPNPTDVLRECYRILKPGGLICLCELALDPDYPRRKTEKRWALEAGFILSEEFGNFLTYQLNFRKNEA
ncbi:methyltransferase domain-containing protein [Candidatus Bathyarchaeota archaeon]|nr:methyltransferase domain-containing protein [Candidatus Bathyarchaeota archaeon]